MHKMNNIKTLIPLLFINISLYSFFFTSDSFFKVDYQQGPPNHKFWQNSKGPHFIGEHSNGFFFTLLSQSSKYGRIPMSGLPFFQLDFESQKIVF